MKVMFNPSIGATLSCRGKNSAAHQVKNELPTKHEGLSNEEIYNAIMNFKNKLTKVFTKEHSNNQLNTFA